MPYEKINYKQFTNHNYKHKYQLSTPLYIYLYIHLFHFQDEKNTYDLLLFTCRRTFHLFIYTI